MRASSSGRGRSRCCSSSKRLDFLADVRAQHALGRAVGGGHRQRGGRWPGPRREADPELCAPLVGDCLVHDLLRRTRLPHGLPCGGVREGEGPPAGGAAGGVTGPAAVAPRAGVRPPGHVSPQRLRRRRPCRQWPRRPQPERRRSIRCAAAAAARAVAGTAPSSAAAAGAEASSVPTARRSGCPGGAALPRGRRLPRGAACEEGVVVGGASPSGGPSLGGGVSGTPGAPTAGGGAGRGPSCPSARPHRAPALGRSPALGLSRAATACAPAARRRCPAVHQARVAGPMVPARPAKRPASPVSSSGGRRTRPRWTRSARSTRARPARLRSSSTSGRWAAIARSMAPWSYGTTAPAARLRTHSISPRVWWWRRSCRLRTRATAAPPSGRRRGRSWRRGPQGRLRPPRPHQVGRAHEQHLVGPLHGSAPEAGIGVRGPVADVQHHIAEALPQLSQEAHGEVAPHAAPHLRLGHAGQDGPVRAPPVEGLQLLGESLLPLPGGLGIGVGQHVEALQRIGVQVRGDARRAAGVDADGGRDGPQGGRQVDGDGGAPRAPRSPHDGDGGQGEGRRLVPGRASRRAPRRRSWRSPSWPGHQAARPRARERRPAAAPPP